MNNIEKATELLLVAASAQILKKAVFSKPEDKNILRAVATVREIHNINVLQIETFLTDNKAIHKNMAIDDPAKLSSLMENYRQVNIITTAGDAEYRRSASGNDTLLGDGKLRLAIEGGVGEKFAAKKNDNAKNYILKGDEKFLVLLGVSDKNGRPHDKKLPKLRQINRFLEYVRDIERHLPTEGDLHICDLCCGKSYLSFAVYYYFTAIKGRRVVMTGVDLKPDVIEYCNSAAKKLGFNGLRFICGDIMKFSPDTLPSLVLSLHACDTATDLVLGKAAEWQAKVILSTPCCHHELNHSINCPDLAFVTEHSMLRQKLCDAATDALRLKKLEAEGYAVSAVELVDPDDTPKNILLRAVLTHKKNAAVLAEYERARAYLLGL
ncbi:MAG: SAM-dependent methyltransferase [Ruminococcaceae bacterium]|nr:SAM-dependent methyltransferase [Oscillospiraceae bacterium]